MDKNAIKKYAVWARRELIERVSKKAMQYGITAEVHADPNADSVDGRLFSENEKKQRQALINKIGEHGYEQTIEEVAYTWFNRFAALRFMEVNGYLPSHVRVFTNDEGEFRPQILSEALRIDMDGINMDKVYELKNADKDEELFNYLIIVQCNALNRILPGMFQCINDFTELLMPDHLLREGSVIHKMIELIPEENWTDQVQIIGWLYQYYNSEKKDSVFEAMKKNIKISTENIAAATQLFTPDWIVCYMVENSLGRLFIDKRKGEGIYADGRDPNELTWDEIESERIAIEKYIADQMGWKYYLPGAIQSPEAAKQLENIWEEQAYFSFEQIRFIDPCMGSGHILAYAFDVLMKIYISYGYTECDAVQSIINYNLYGLELDKRAYQLAYFAVMMKARQYDRRLWKRIEDGKFDSHLPNLSHFQDMPAVNYSILDEPIKSFVEQFKNADTYGSLITVQVDENIDEALDEFHGVIGLDLEKMEHLMRLYKVLSQHYDVVCTNPPYMGSRNGMNDTLYNYVNEHFPDSKADLYSAFIEKCSDMTTNNGYYSMITQQGWMFLTSFIKLRKNILKTDIVNMLHLGSRAFDEVGGEVVQSTTFVIRKTNVSNYNAIYYRLTDGNNEEEKRKLYLSGNSTYIISKEKFCFLKEDYIAYWLSSNMFEVFKNKSLGEYAKPRQGMATSDNNRFLRYWYEINNNKVCFSAKDEDEALNSNAKWFPYNKGGGFRKWYGNNDYLINWENNGHEVKELAVKLYKCVTRTIKNIQFYFKKGITWSTLTTGIFNARFCNYGFLFDTKGSTCYFNNDSDIPYFIAFLNSVVANELLKVLAPTLDYNAGSIAKIPIIINDSNKSEVDSIAQENINMSKQDWDSFETSWDFKKHPLI